MDNMALMHYVPATPSSTFMEESLDKIWKWIVRMSEACRNVHLEHLMDLSYIAILDTTEGIRFISNFPSFFLTTYFQLSSGSALNPVPRLALTPGQDML